MTLSFPSPEWATACEQAVNASDAYRQAAATWTHGAVALVVNARPEIGLPNPVGIWLFLVAFLGACVPAMLYRSRRRSARHSCSRPTTPAGSR